MGMHPLRPAWVFKRPLALPSDSPSRFTPFTLSALPSPWPPISRLDSASARFCPASVAHRYSNLHLIFHSHSRALLCLCSVSVRVANATDDAPPRVTIRATNTAPCLIPMGGRRSGFWCGEYGELIFLVSAMLFLIRLEMSGSGLGIGMVWCF